MRVARATPHSTRVGSESVATSTRAELRPKPGPELASRAVAPPDLARVRVRVRGRGRARGYRG